MKKTLIIATLLVLGVAFQTSAASSNQSQGNSKPSEDGKTTATTPVKGTQSGNAVKTSEQNAVKNQGESTQIQTQEQNAVQTKDSAKNKDKKNKGKVNAESHRNTISAFVQSLSDIADRENGIGQELRSIAKAQNDAKDRASDLINAVESRSKIKTFFIGTSYKNLGELRSQMVQTQNQIEQLKRLAEKMENEGDKTELQSQIQILEQEQTSINNFITQNENKFSLFGWAVKLFRK